MDETLEDRIERLEFEVKEMRKVLHALLHSPPGVKPLHEVVAESDLPKLNTNA